jgi:hypothetical protein
LDEIKVREATCSSNWGIMKVAIGRSVDFHDKVREEDVHAKTIHANETASPLMLMGPKVVKWAVKVGYMETIADENILAIEGVNGCAVTKDGSKRIDTHPDVPARDRIISNER